MMKFQTWNHLLRAVLLICISANLANGQVTDEPNNDEMRQVLDLFRKTTEYVNKPNWQEYIRVASDDMKRVWLLDSTRISFAPTDVATEFRRQFETDDELAQLRHAHNKEFSFETTELEGYELDDQYAKQNPDDLVVKHYGAGYARSSAHQLRFELVDRELLYILRYYGSLPRLYYESEPVKVEISGNDAVVFAKARMPKKFFGTVGGQLEFSVLEPIPVYFKKIDGSWKLSPFPPSSVQK